MIPADRVYADPGDRLSGRYDPPRLCTVTAQWGRGGGPRNVAVRYLDDGATSVIPFSRRLRRASESAYEPEGWNEPAYDRSAFARLTELADDPGWLGI